MNSAIKMMLDRYKCSTRQDYVNALKEIIQEVALVGLWRSKFFEGAAFYGGTALRILFQLDRFSEDLDFTLLKPTPTFSLTPYLHAIQAELDAFGFSVNVMQKDKSNQSAIQSAFLKGNTLEHLLKVGIPSQIYGASHREEILKIKLEVDTDPPPAFETTTRFLTLPIPCSVRVVAEGDLFAGKMHALLCRSWKSRVKGRDWYDLIWYVSKQIPLHLGHLEQRMRQSGHFSESDSLSEERLKDLIAKRIATISIDEAKEDILPFVRDPSVLAVWSPEFFTALAERIKTI